MLVPAYLSALLITSNSSLLDIWNCFVVLTWPPYFVLVITPIKFFATSLLNFANPKSLLTLEALNSDSTWPSSTSVVIASKSKASKSLGVPMCTCKPVPLSAIWWSTKAETKSTWSMFSLFKMGDLISIFGPSIPTDHMLASYLSSLLMLMDLFKKLIASLQPSSRLLSTCTSTKSSQLLSAM